MSRPKRHVTLENPYPSDGRQKPKFWTLERQWRLAEYLERGMSYELIAKKFGVSREAVRLARKDYGIRSPYKMHLSAQDIAKLLGMDWSHAVGRWIKAGWLKGRKLRFGKRGWYSVRYSSFIAFLENPEHHHRWHPDRITDLSLREWAREIWTGPFLTQGEVAWRLCVDRGTVHTWIQRGLLPAVRNGNWVVRESDLEGFTVPSHIPRTGRIRQWTPEEDETVIRMRADGASWSEIGRKLDRWPSVCCNRFDRLMDQEVAA